MLPHLHTVPPYNPNEFSCTAKKPKKAKKYNENRREKNQSANEPLALQWPPKTCVMASSLRVCVGWGRQSEIASALCMCVNVAAYYKSATAAGAKRIWVKGQKNTMLITLKLYAPA